MKHLRFAALALGLSAAPAVAQDVPRGFEEVGRFETVIDGTPETFVAVREVATGRSYITSQAVAGRTSINVAGKSIAPGAGARIVSILIGPFSGAFPSEASFEIYDGPNIWAANVDTGYKVTLSNVVRGDNGSLSFSFDGDAIPAQRDVNEGTLVPVAGAEPIGVYGTFSGSVPVAE